jgi:hypothetical protein
MSDTNGRHSAGSLWAVVALALLAGLAAGCDGGGAPSSTAPYAALRAYAADRAGYTMGVHSPHGRRVGEVGVRFTFDRAGELVIRSHSRIDFNKLEPATGSPRWGRGGSDRTLTADCERMIGADGTLGSVRVTSRLGELAALSAGSAADSRLTLTTDRGGERTQNVVPLSADRILYTGMIGPVALPGLSKGQTWRFSRLDPFTQELADGRGTVRRETTLELGGQRFRVWEVELSAGSFRATLWVHPGGDVLKAESHGVAFLREGLWGD